MDGESAAVGEPSLATPSANELGAEGLFRPGSRADGTIPRGVHERDAPRRAAASRPSPAVDVRRSSLRVNFGWTLAGNVIYAGCQWAIVVVIAKTGTPEAVGRFALGLAVSGPVFLLASMHLRGVQATDAARLFRFSDYFGVRVAAMAAGLLLSVVVVGISGYGRDDAAVVLAVALSKTVEGVSDVHYGFMQQCERMRPIAISLMWRGALSVVVVGGVLWAGGTLLTGVLALSGVWLAVLIGHDARAAAPLLRAAGEQRLPRFDAPTMRRVVAMTFPLGLVMMAVSLRTNVPRYFIERDLGTASLGVFAALSSLVAAGTMVVSAMGQSATPRLARHHHEGNLRAFRRLLWGLLAVAACLGGAGIAVAAVIGEPLLRILFGPEYAARSHVFLWLIAAGSVAYASSFLGYALTAARLLKIQLPLFTSTAVACAALCVWLVPQYGLSGAVWAWGLALALELLVSGGALAVALRRRGARQ